MMKWIGWLCTLYLSFSSIRGDCLETERNLFLWTIEKSNGKQVGYLFGTIHVPYTRIWDRVSNRVKEAFHRANSVILEVDLQDPSTLRRLIKCKNLKGKQRSLQYLGPELHQRLQHYFASYRKKLISVLKERDDAEAAQAVIANFNQAIGGWDRRRAEWLLFVLYQLCDNNLDREDSPMLDAYLAEMAAASGKDIHSIETANEQCNPVQSLSEEQVVFAINYTLSYLEYQLITKRNPSLQQINRSRRTYDIVRSYECGSLENDVFKNTHSNEKFGSHFNQSDVQRAKQIDLILKDDILIKRNFRMADRLDKVISKDGETNFFAALGTGHFIGEKNILDLLKDKGYTIKPVKEDDIV
ncbi:unnamed protein product, partial [Mesorhabditis belari]|uniref:Metalloprotease TIKI homolog n=1 Tax=Mesorhabditis belari TaxID=2138241 RepID=A0AAF3ERJ4_9BILA